MHDVISSASPILRHFAPPTRSQRSPRRQSIDPTASRGICATAVVSRQQARGVGDAGLARSVAALLGALLLEER